MTDNEIRAQREKCADCGGALQEIKVRQNGHQSVAVALFYFSKDAKENTFWGVNAPAVEGTLLAFMCSSCARVSFYGATKEPKANDKDKANDKQDR